MGDRPHRGPRSRDGARGIAGRGDVRGSVRYSGHHQPSQGRDHLTMRLTLLGTGTSMGVPQIGCGCAVCHSIDPHDRRTRTSAIIEVGDTRLLVDTPPELRLQLLGAGITNVDAVLYTHQHADHVHGIDDLRSFTLTRHAPLPLYGPAETIAHLRRSFNYIFDRN